MKLISKRASLIVLVLAVVYLTCPYALSYWCGYSFTPTGFFSLLNDLLKELGFILLPVLLIMWIVSLFRRQHRLWTTAMLAGLLILMGIKYVLPSPDVLTLYGMRDGMLRNYKLDGIRRFARDFDQLPRLPNTLETQKLFYWNRDLTNTGLKEKYPFLAQSEFVGEADNEVEVVWRHYWHLEVAVDGKRIEPNLEMGDRIIRVSDDIYFTFKGAY